MTEPARILIVDDNEMNRDMLARRLERDGHEVVLAENGPQALECLITHPIDLMLLDIMMPQMSGYEVLERVKENTSLPYIPVIIISAVSDLNSVVRCIEIGAEDYLFKPFNPILLKARVDASLSRKRLSDWQQQHLTQLERHSVEGTTPLLAGAHHIANSSVLFMEIVDIDRIAGFIEPAELLDVLNAFLADVQHLVTAKNLMITRSLAGLYRINGDVTRHEPEHACIAADTALALRSAARHFHFSTSPLTVRIGIGTGASTTGVIEAGQYDDLWGDAVYDAQLALRMAAPGSVCLSLSAYQQLPASRYITQVMHADQSFYELQESR